VPLLSVSAIFGDVKLMLPFMATRKSVWVVLGPAFVIALGLFVVACTDGRAPVQQPGPTDTEVVSPTPQATSTPAAFETPASFDGISPEAIWNPVEDEARLARIHECTMPRLAECAIATMEELGASPQAVDFFRTTGWFLSDFQEMGRVDLGSIVNPWRANANGDFALLNGTPSVVLAEAEGRLVDVAIERDSAYDMLVTLFPDLLLWPTDNVFETLGASLQEGQRFIFQFYLNNGCHACRTGYMGRVALDFAPDGTYSFPLLLGLCRAAWQYGTPAATSVPACPPPAEAAPTEVIPDFSQSALPEIHAPTSRVVGDPAPTAAATSDYCLNRVGAPVIQGSDDFKQRTREALAILPTENSSLVGCWLQAILEGPSSSGGSGVDVDTGVYHATGDHAFAYPDPQISTIFYASSIVHDAVHVRDYWQGRPSSGADGELSALQVQLEVLQALGSPPWMIACTQEIVDNIHDSSYQFWNGADPPCTLAQETS